MLLLTHLACVDGHLFDVEVDALYDLERLDVSMLIEFERLDEVATELMNLTKAVIEAFSTSRFIILSASPKPVFRRR